MEEEKKKKEQEDFGAWVDQAERFINGQSPVKGYIDFLAIVDLVRKEKPENIINIMEKGPEESKKFYREFGKIVRDNKTHKEILDKIIKTEQDILNDMEALKKRGLAKYTNDHISSYDDLYFLNKYITMAGFMAFDRAFGKENITEKTPKKEKALIKAGIHLIEQFYGDPKQLNGFSDLEEGRTFKERMEEHIKTLGLTAQDTPKGYGAILNQTTKQVLEGILKKFTETDYMGDYTEDITSSLEGTNTATNIKESQRAKQRIEKIYPGEKIPVIRFNSQADLIRMAGFDSTGYNREHVEQAITTLISEQFCFYWKRLKYEKGRPVINKQSGKYEMEEVMEIGPFFRHRTIRDNDKNISFELLPSAPLIDQINSYYGGGQSGYFILFPEDWRQRVKKITGKTPPSYTIEFLMWLRLQYAHIQRYNTRLEKAKERKKRIKESPRKYEIKKTWEEMAIILQMPESMYKKNRKRARAIIQSAYETAVKVGYLLKVKDNGASDTLYLNKDFYIKEGQLINE